MFSITTSKDMNITQFDVRTSNSICEIEEDIYMTHPLGFDNIKEVRKVCRLCNALYGL